MGRYAPAAIWAPKKKQTKKERKKERKKEKMEEKHENTSAAGCEQMAGNVNWETLEEKKSG